MSKAVVLEWNGQDVPAELRGLPAGRYVVAPVDESVVLTPEEEAGLVAALASASTRTVPHDEVMARARKLVGA
ncbi:MAG: hypothetical protein FJ104_14480 [Deltaproteobacteria bacterium]|nr:hypothetical protein [Deltaproteobacteria bacterium]